MTATPATMVRKDEYTRKRPPIAEALAPSATNTVVNPNTNNSAVASSRRATSGLGSRAIRLSNVVPARKHRYGGTSGSTQGDRKLTRPASSAAGMETSVIALLCRS
jgi:hypothetical protein